MSFATGSMNWLIASIPTALVLSGTLIAALFAKTTEDPVLRRLNISMMIRCGVIAGLLITGEIFVYFQFESVLNW
jgi:hypothetical protein